MTTANQQAAFEKPVVPAAWFVEMEFSSGTLRICSYTQTYTWGGYDWTGLGSVGTISSIVESTGSGAAAMTFGLNIAATALLALGVGVVEDYRGRNAKLYFCPLDSTGNLIDTPELCWRGRMDVMTSSVDGEDGQIVLKCETSSFGLKRSSMRLNAAQQKQRYPTDTGFDYLNSLISDPQVWLSKKFQQI